MRKSRSIGTRRFALAALLVAAGYLGASSAARSASAASLCVGGQAGCYGSVQAAVDAAHDGDTIGIGAGTFQGGITIDKSIRLVGAGTAATTIQGGGPVVTIGDLTGATTPTVSIRG